MQTYPAWSTTLLNPQTGTKRQAEQLSNTDIGVIRQEYNNRPRLFSLYALWLYAQNTGDWSYIQNNWSSINSFYNNNRTEATRYYSSLAGAIGYARLAQQKIPADQTAINTALADINTGLTNGRNYNQIATQTETIFQFQGGERWEYTRANTFMGFQFIDITPEIGRYMAGDLALKQTIIGTSSDDFYTLTPAESINHFWYMAQAPTWNTYYGEGSGNHPDARAMIFPLKVWVQNEPPTPLRKYIDVPDALIGDYYYMQNIARTIEAHGSQCWENIQTTSLECVDSTITPTIILGDVNGDGQVTSADVIETIRQFGKTPTATDLNNDNIVNILDTVIVLTHLNAI
jgi:hypothetical protein